MCRGRILKGEWRVTILNLIVHMVDIICATCVLVLLSIFCIFDLLQSVGLHLQHGGKKPKISKPPFENTFDNMAAVTGSVPSPVASQNNMSHTNKILKLFRGQDKGQKAKSLKVNFDASLMEFVLHLYWYFIYFIFFKPFEIYGIDD